MGYLVPLFNNLGQGQQKTFVCSLVNEDVQFQFREQEIAIQVAPCL